MRKMTLATDPYSSRWFAQHIALMTAGKDFGYRSDLVKSLEEAFTIGELPEGHRDAYENVARKVGTIPYPANHWTNDAKNELRNMK